MGIFDKFLNAVKLNDDYDDDDEFFDEEDDIQEDTKPKKRFFKKLDDDDDDFDDEPAPRKSSSGRSTVKESSKAAPSPKSSKPAPKPRNSSKITPMTGRSNVSNSMEVCVIRPKGMEDTQEIADTLLAGCTVFLNLEGVDVDMAQRIIDFCSGACYAIGGALQKASSYIFIMAPANVDISGDFQHILSNNSSDMAPVRMSY